MNWVGGARNRLKLKHETKLQKEFFERKRQEKSNGRTRTAIPKLRERVSQDLFSLEVIMSAHRNIQKRVRGRASPNPQEKEKEIPGKSCIQGLTTKADHMHLTPELHQVRKTSQVQ